MAHGDGHCTGFPSGEQTLHLLEIIKVKPRRDSTDYGGPPIPDMRADTPEPIALEGDLSVTYFKSFR